MTRVKVCGITTPGDRDATVAAGADAFGVVVDVPIETPREVTRSTAVDLVATAPPFVSTVLVTMPSGVEPALGLARTVEPNAIQLHGSLSPEDVGRIAAQTPATVISVVPADSPAVAAHADAADAVMVDAVGPEGGGGTGETVDWQRTADMVSSLDAPVILAGGLTPGNVAEAITTVTPAAVDVATGVERTGGRKDHEAVAAFVDRAAAVEGSA